MRLHGGRGPPLELAGVGRRPARVRGFRSGTRERGEFVRDRRDRPFARVAVGRAQARKEVRGRRGVDRKRDVGVAQREFVRERERDASGFEHAAVVIIEDRNQDPGIAGMRLAMPLDVEERLEQRPASVLEHVPPPRVGQPRDSHVVRDEVQEHAESVGAQPRREQVEAVAAAEFRIHLAVVGDVVPVRAAGRGREDRRQVEIRDPQVAEVGEQAREVRECEPAVQLHPVGADRHVGAFSERHGRAPGRWLPSRRPREPRSSRPRRPPARRDLRNGTPRCEGSRASSARDAPARGRTAGARGC